MLGPTDLLLWGIVVHLLADWPLQTEWMAIHKANLRHPAAWVHSGIHTAFMVPLFSWPIALLIGITHLLIDTGKPVDWWMFWVKKMPRTHPQATMVEKALDQVFHILVLAGVALILP